MTTEKPLNLRQKLIEIRKSIDYIQKTEKGKTSAYVDSAVLLKKVRDGMDKYGVMLSLEVIDSKNIQISAPTAKNKENVDYLSDNKMLFTWLDADSDEKILCNWHAVASNMQDPAMAFGSALTYSERYFLLKYFQIPTANDDPDRFAQKMFNANDTASQDQLFQLDRIMKNHDLVDTEKDLIVKFYCDHTNLKELTVSGCIDLMQKFDVVFDSYLKSINPQDPSGENG